MKKIILFFCFSLLVISTFAQFPDPGSKGFTFGLNGLQGISLSAAHTSTLQYKLSQNENFIWRFSGVLTLTNYGSTSTSGGRYYDNESRNSTVGIGIGCEKVIAKVNRFRIYGGGDLVPMMTSGTSTSSNTIIDETLTGNGLNGDFSKSVTKNPSIINIGLYPFLGFEYFISKNFSIGAEFSFGISYSLDAKSSTVSSSRVNGINQPDISNSSEQKPQFNFNSTNGAVITGSVYF